MSEDDDSSSISSKKSSSYGKLLSKSISQVLGVVGSRLHLSHIGQQTKGHLRIFIGTWNMAGKKPPENLSPFVNKCPQKNEEESELNSGNYHLVIIGVQESVPVTSANILRGVDRWEKLLTEHLEASYFLVRTESLAAINIAVFCLKPYIRWIQAVDTCRIATGIGNVIGNKGATAVAVKFGDKSILLVNSHLTAHQSKVIERNADYKRIEKELYFSKFSRKKKQKRISSAFDYVFWFGDLNYRINGTRKMVETLVFDERKEVLIANDQLTIERKKGTIFQEFNEAAISFPPTYKYRIFQPLPLSLESSYQDTPLDSPETPGTPMTAMSPFDDGNGTKVRIPSWTDRILYRSSSKFGRNVIEVETYSSVMEISTSDHKPVYGVFKLEFDWKQDILEKSIKKKLKRNEKKNKKQISQVCIIQ